MYTFPIFIPPAGVTNVLASAASGSNEERIGCIALQSGQLRKLEAVFDHLAALLTSEALTLNILYRFSKTNLTKATRSSSLVVRYIIFKQAACNCSVQ